MRPAPRIAEVEGGDPIGVGQLDPLDVQADHQVGAHLVGKGRAAALLHQGRCRWSGEQDLGADSGEATFQSSAHVGDDRRLGLCESLIGIGPTGVENDHLAGDPAAHRIPGDAFTQRCGEFTLSDGAGELVQGPEGSRPAHPIGIDADVALELPHR